MDFPRLNRRGVIELGALGLCGLSLPAFWQRRARGAAQPAPRAKACIVIFHFGGPSHLDTFDLKPDAPKEIRGEFRPIGTAAPGQLICEHLPLMAAQAHRFAIVRSMHHTDPQHNNAGYRMLTGADPPLLENTVAALARPKPDDHPPFGSVVTQVRQSAAPWVSLPYEMINGVPYPGQAAGFLGAAYEPLWLKTDPSRGHDLAFRDLELPDELNIRRVRTRGDLLQTIDRDGQISGAANMSMYQSRAMDLLTSNATRLALQIDRESPQMRDRYGRNVFGQSCLMARRLIEAEIPLVAVYTYGADGFINTQSWDTHANNFRDLKDKILPIQDRGYAVLLDDLAERGLLDETLVVWFGEFGRDPKINGNGGGRDHWPFVFSALLAGGGIRGGISHGASDASGAYPAADAVSPQDMAATIYHCLGIDPRTEIRDRLGRPFEVALGGKPVLPLMT
ncbi:MAG: DUF1501 domain-containing protein [Planctomycetia bacterium]|nr:DUF1501 domain-containing protein [Planctomycetia bacterium]